jgi:hypothetical protein
MWIGPPAARIRAGAVCCVRLHVRFVGVFILPEDVLRTCTSKRHYVSLPDVTKVCKPAEQPQRTGCVRWVQSAKPLFRR